MSWVFDDNCCCCKVDFGSERDFNCKGAAGCEGETSCEEDLEKKVKPKCVFAREMRAGN
jgi:hypothetical protein